MRIASRPDAAASFLRSAPACDSSKASRRNERRSAPPLADDQQPQDSGEEEQRDADARTATALDRSPPTTTPASGRPFTGCASFASSARSTACASSTSRIVLPRRKRKRSVGGGGAGHPASRANLRRGVTRAPVGNDRAVRHGAYARIAVEQLGAKRREIFEALSADAPLRAHDGGLPSADGVAVRLLADCLVRLDRVGEFATGREKTDQGRRAIEIETRLRSQALDLCESLGMTPRSRARLGIDVRRARSFGLARAWAEEDVIDGEVADG